MSQGTDIQWSDDTANLAGGCSVLCELRPGPALLRSVTKDYLSAEFPGIARSVIDATVDEKIGEHNASEIFQLRFSIGHDLIFAIAGAEVSHSERQPILKRLEAKIRQHFICYAHRITMRYGFDIRNPTKRLHPGLARQFETVQKFPGRMAAAAGWPDLFGKIRTRKPWLDFLPRLIFVSDMADALSAEIDFEYLRDELITAVCSNSGKRHLWLWLTKNPKRMAEFGRWLQSQGIEWPTNLVAMTSVTSQKTVSRVEQLMGVPSRFKALSVEPLWGEVTLPLAGIDWCIVGGQSGDLAKPFDLSWITSLRGQCKESGTALFVKQLGSNVVRNGQALKLKDRHGGEWTEWPAAFRTREMPRGFYDYGTERTFKKDQNSVALSTPTLIEEMYK